MTLIEWLMNFKETTDCYKCEYSKDHCPNTLICKKDAERIVKFLIKNKIATNLKNSSEDK